MRSLPPRVLFRRTVLFHLAVGLIAAARLRGGPPIDVLELVSLYRPAENTAAIAARQGFLFNGIAPGEKSAVPLPGDSVTALVSLFTVNPKTAPTQWLVRLRLAATAPGPAAPGGATRTIFSNTGETCVFRSTVTSMEMETIGPIAPQAPADAQLASRHNRLAVSTDFLALNLVRTADVIAAIRRHAYGPDADAAPASLQIANKRFTSAEIAAARRKFSYLSADEVRSFAGALPALQQFVQIVGHTPDLARILMKVFDKPSLIDVLHHGSASLLNYRFGEVERSEPSRAYFFGAANDVPVDLLGVTLEIYGKPALQVAFFVAPPDPPLLTSAGLVGIVAWSPTRPDKFVTVRLVSATRAAASPSPGDPAAAPPVPPR